MDWNSFQKANKGKSWTPAKFAVEYKKYTYANRHTDMSIQTEPKEAKTRGIQTTRNLADEVSYCAKVMERNKRLEAMVNKSLHRLK